MLETPNDIKSAHRVIKLYTQNGFNISELARSINRNNRTVNDWVKKAQRIISEYEGDDLSEQITVVYFTDAHNQPKHNFDRFELLAKFVNDVQPDYLVDGGDFDDFESLCSHVKNDTHKAKLKPAFYEDFEHSVKAHKILNDLIKVEGLKKHRTLGNHEHRMWLYEDSRPEVHNTIVPKYEDMCRIFGWELTPYGGFLDIGGVDFTHVPFNGMAKPMGGKQPHVTMCNSLMRDMVFGHTHSYGLHTAHKLGDQRHVRALNGGCFMVEEYMPSYAKNSQKSFWYGAHKILIQNGKMDVISYPMSELKRKYG